MLASAMVLNNREISVAAWFLVLLLWALSKPSIRRAAFGVAKALLKWKILLALLMMFAYIALVVMALNAAGLWALDLLKATVLWCCTAALVMVFDVASVASDESYFKRAVWDGMRLSVLLEFFVNFYVLSIFLELLLVPMLAVVSSMLVLVEYRQEFKQLRLPLNTLLAVVGLGLLGYSGYRVFAEPGSFLQPTTLFEFLLPIALTISFLPFLYILATVITYENLFVRLRFLMPDPDLRRFTKARLLWRFHLNFRAVNRWGRRFAHERPRSRQAVIDSMKEVSDNHCEGE